LGIGFGSGMINVDMNIIEFLSDNTYNLYDTWATGYEMPSVDIDIGGTYDLKNVKYEHNNSNITIQYERLLDTGDSKDQVIQHVSRICL
jgi:hypothetical protein